MYRVNVEAFGFRRQSSASFTTARCRKHPNRNAGQLGRGFDHSTNSEVAVYRDFDRIIVTFERNTARRLRWRNHLDDGKC